MLKKLFLLILGGAIAAGGFFFYTNMPQSDADALAEKISNQKVNLQNIAQDLVNSEAVQSVLEKGREHLLASDQAQEWLGKMVQTYAKEVKGVELSTEDAGEMIDVLMELRQFSDQAAKQGVEDVQGFSMEHQQQFQTIMSRGDEVFQRNLNMSMTEFLASINRASLENGFITFSKLALTKLA